MNLKGLISKYVDETAVKQSEILKVQETVERMKTEGLTTIEAIAEIAQQNDMEMEDIVRYLGPKLLADCVIEAHKLNLVDKKLFATLPIPE